MANANMIFSFSTGLQKMSDNIPVMTQKFAPPPLAVKLILNPDPEFGINGVVYILAKPNGQHQKGSLKALLTPMSFESSQLLLYPPGYLISAWPHLLLQGFLL